MWVTHLDSEDFGTIAAGGGEDELDAGYVHAWSCPEGEGGGFALGAVMLGADVELSGRDAVGFLVDDDEKIVGVVVEEVDGAFQQDAVDRDADGHFAPVAADGYGFLDGGGLDGGGLDGSVDQAGDFGCIYGVLGGRPGDQFCPGWTGTPVARRSSPWLKPGASRRRTEVNCTAPGQVFTPLVAERLDDEGRQRRATSGLIKDEGTAWDVGWAAVYLASDEARWVTGQVLTVDHYHYSWQRVRVESLAGKLALTWLSVAAVSTNAARRRSLTCGPCARLE